MHQASSCYPLPAENLYGAHPAQCRSADALFIGAGAGLGSVPYLLGQAKATGSSLQVVVADAGPFDLLTHVAHIPGFTRAPFLKAGTERVGGKLTVWGMSTPPPQAPRP